MTSSAGGVEGYEPVEINFSGQLQNASLSLTLSHFSFSFLWSSLTIYQGRTRPDRSRKAEKEGRPTAQRTIGVGSNTAGPTRCWMDPSMTPTGFMRLARAVLTAAVFLGRPTVRTRLSCGQNGAVILRTKWARRPHPRLTHPAGSASSVKRLARISRLLIGFGTTLTIAQGTSLSSMSSVRLIIYGLSMGCLLVAYRLSVGYPLAFHIC